MFKDELVYALKEVSKGRSINKIYKKDDDRKAYLSTALTIFYTRFTARIWSDVPESQRAKELLLLNNSIVNKHFDLDKNTKELDETDKLIIIPTAKGVINNNLVTRWWLRQLWQHILFAGAEPLTEENSCAVKTLIEKLTGIRYVHGKPTLASYDSVRNILLKANPWLSEFEFQEQEQ